MFASKSLTQRLRRTSTNTQSSTATVADECPAQRRTSRPTLGQEPRKSSISSLKFSLPVRNGKNKDLGIVRTVTACDNTGAEQHDVVHVPAGFLALPNELHVLIISYLKIDDVLALRATCTAYNGIASVSGSAIARYCLKFKLHPLSETLYPLRISGDYWSHTLGLVRRWRVAHNVANMVVSHVQYKTLSYYTTQEHARFRPVADRMRRKMRPLLFVIGHHLRVCQHMFLERLAVVNDVPSLEEEIEFGALRGTFTAYAEEDLLGSVHNMWLFMLWFLNHIMSRPSYAGTVERTLRGWTTDPLDGCALAAVLIHGGLSALKHLLRLKTYQDRKKWALNFLESLQPQHNVKWADNWRQLDLDNSDMPSKTMATNLCARKLTIDSLWVDGITAMLHDKQLALADVETQGNARFASSLAGYDLFRGPPPENWHDDYDTDEDLHAPTPRMMPEGTIGLDQERQQDVQENPGLNYWDV